MIVKLSDEWRLAAFAQTQENRLNKVRQEGLGVSSIEVSGAAA